MANQELTQSNNLSPTERQIVECFKKTADHATIAKIVGVSAVTVDRALGRPHVQAAIHADVARRIREGSSLALGVLERILEDESASSKVRADVAKTLLDRAGFQAPKDGARSTKSPSDMSSDELHDASQRIRNELANRAKTVDIDAQQDEKSNENKE